MKDRNALRGGAYSLAISAVVLAILVVVNVFVSALPSSLTKYDISTSKLYSITSNTKAVAAALEQDVTIYWVVQSGQEDEVIENLLSKYDSLSGHIQVVKKNPDVYPTFAQQYTDETVRNNSLIVECGERSRFIGYDDIYVQEADLYSYSYSTSFDGEGAITSAIDYVVSQELPQVYILEGHGEADLPSSFQEQMEDEIPSFDHVTGIQFSGAQSYEIAYEEDSPAAYSQDDVYFTRRDGKTLPLDTSRVEDYLRSITALDPIGYVSYHVTDGELQSYGLDAPELTITVNYTAEEGDGQGTADTFTLHVSPDPEDVKAAEGAEDGEEAEISAYIRVGESQIVYEISSSSYKKLAAASYNDLRHPQAIWADFSDVRQLDVSLEGERYTFTSRQEGDERVWSYQGEEFEMAGLRNDLTALSAQEFTTQQPAQKEEIRLTVHLDHENVSQIQIALYRYDAARCLAVVDGESVSLVDRAAVVDLIEAVHAIVLD